MSTTERKVRTQIIGTVGGHVEKRFANWDVARDWRDNGEDRQLYGMPRLSHGGDE